MFNVDNFINKWNKDEETRIKMLQEQIKKGCDKCSQWDDYWGCCKCENIG